MMKIFMAWILFARTLLSLDREIWMNVIIRQANFSDKPHWMELWDNYNHLFGTVIPSEQSELTWTSILNNDDIGCLLACDAESKEVYGFLQYILHSLVWTPKKSLYIDSLFVKSSFRRLGVARSLLDCVKEIGHDLECANIYWMTKKDNIFARKLYSGLAAGSEYVKYQIFIN